MLVYPKAVIGEQVEFGVGPAVISAAIDNCYTKVGKGCIIST